jgi:hypothetical protein
MSQVSTALPVPQTLDIPPERDVVPRTLLRHE